MGLLGAPKEVFWQFFIREDGACIFRQLDVDDDWLIEKKQNKEYRSFMLKYELEKHFEGHKNVPAGNVIIGFSRDILVDTHNRLPESDKPEKGDSLNKPWITKKVMAVCNRHEQNAKPVSVADKMVIFMGAVAVILALAIGLKVAL